MYCAKGDDPAMIVSRKVVVLQAQENDAPRMQPMRIAKKRPLSMHPSRGTTIKEHMIYNATALAMLFPVNTT
jgi:hypothetical protein